MHANAWFMNRSKANMPKPLDPTTLFLYILFKHIKNLAPSQKGKGHSIYPKPALIS
jgi:hypothetical protein